MIKVKVSKEELLHIANLADLKIKDDEIDNYLANLQDILNFAEVVNKAPIEDLQETIGANENSNVFRKDEVKIFENHEGLMANAPEKKEICLKYQRLYLKRERNA